MEPNQTSQMVAWLDEERRKDKAVITKLEERAAAQAALIEDQAQRLQALENELAAIRASVLTPSFVNDSITRLRNEVTSAVEQVEQRRVAVTQDLKRIRDQDRESFNRALEELRQEVQARLQREMQPRRTAEERLSRVATELQAYADSLSKGMEDFERSLKFLEEQRRQDTKRITETSGQLMELSKKQEAQQTKVELMEEISRRNERAVEELMGTLTEIKQQRQAWVEQEALASQRREQAITDILRRMDHFDDQMEGYVKQFIDYSETNRAMKKGIEEFDRIADRVDRRLTEVVETQRIAEDRFRQEWEAYQQEEQKRWRQFTLTNEESWREHTRTVDQLNAGLEEMTEQVQTLVEYARYVRRTNTETLRQISDALHTVWEEVDDNTKSLPSLS